MSNLYNVPGWLDQIQEEILEPDRPIIDPHHHLWHGPEDPPGIKDTYRYLLEDLWRDTSSGHNIKKTVYIDCGQEYYQEGPDAFNRLGRLNLLLV